DRLQRRTPRQRAQPVALEIGQNRIEPAANAATVKLMLRPQRPHQRVLHEIVGKLAITRERTRITAPSRQHGLDRLPEPAQPPSPPIPADDDGGPRCVDSSPVVTSRRYHPDKHFAASGIPAA